MDLGNARAAHVITYKVGTGFYACLLRKRCVSVDQVPLKSIAAEGIYL